MRGTSVAYRVFDEFKFLKPETLKTVWETLMKGVSAAAFVSTETPGGLVNAEIERIFASRDSLGELIVRELHFCISCKRRECSRVIAEHTYCIHMLNQKPGYMDPMQVAKTVQLYHGGGNAEAMAVETWGAKPKQLQGLFDVDTLRLFSENRVSLNPSTVHKSVIFIFWDPNLGGESENALLAVMYDVDERTKMAIVGQMSGTASGGEYVELVTKFVLSIRSHKLFRSQTIVIVPEGNLQGVVAGAASTIMEYNAQPNVYWYKADLKKDKLGCYTVKDTKARMTACAVAAFKESNVGYCSYPFATGGDQHETVDSCKSKLIKELSQWKCVVKPLAAGRVLYTYSGKFASCDMSKPVYNDDLAIVFLMAIYFIDSHNVRYYASDGRFVSFSKTQ